ncbi:capsule assembly Wzi family protein [Arundinibacter roseus]|uniref:capsule assembly Wzi family protein n=1 Tax=Arundinibacter roseus TaxID=2070510 RepID=UPI0014054DA6|nr:capsule assembly Wzi family protein [Arundinibacter roseus]
MSFLLFHSAYSQSPAFGTTAEMGSYQSSSNQIPFWLRANQWGQVPMQASFGTVRLGMYLHADSTCAEHEETKKKSTFGWSAGAQVVTTFGSQNTYLLPEAYLKVRWKHLQITAGRQKEAIGIMDTTLTSGSYSWSGNALPVPKINVGFADYVPIHFLRDFLSVKGNYAHGWFKENYIKGVFLHQKTLHARFGKPSSRVHVQVGINHHVTWGGQAEYLDNSPLAVDGKLTRNFKDYLWGVVLANIPRESRTSRFTQFDGTNRVGNHVGHYDLAIDWTTKRTKFLVYRQHPFEDGSGLQIQNLPDGLYGFSVRPLQSSGKVVAWKGLVLEYLHTRNQSGNDFDLTGTRFKGLDNYFNHAQYAQGWSYRDKGLGTPFLPTRLEVSDSIRTTGEFFPSNSVILYHIGLEALLLNKVHVLAKASYSLHFGTINIPFERRISQFSSLLALDMPLSALGHIKLNGQLAWDKGGLYPSSLGSYLGIRAELAKMKNR